MMNFIKRAMSPVVALSLCFQPGLPSSNTNRYLPIWERPDSYFNRAKVNASQELFYFTASTAQSRSGSKAGLGELGGSYNLKDVIAGYRAVRPNDLVQAQFGSIADLTRTSLPFGVSGRLEGAGCCLRLDYAVFNHGFSVGASLPVMTMRRITRFDFHDKDFQYNRTASELYDLDRAVDSLRRVMHTKIGFTSLWSKGGLGDLDLHVRFNKYFDHVLLTRTIKLAAQVGLVCPVGEQVTPEEPASVAFGNDGHYGIKCNGVVSAELKQDLTVGLQVGFVHLFSKTKNARISVGAEPVMFSALTARVREHQGACLTLSPFLTLGNIADGLDFQARYTYLRHAQNTLQDLRSDQTIQSYLQKDAALISAKHNLSKWRSHYFSFNLNYDCAGIIDKNKIAPRFFIGYDMPIDGSAFVKMHTVQLGAELHF